MSIGDSIARDQERTTVWPWALRLLHRGGANTSEIGGMRPQPDWGLVAPCDTSRSSRV